MKKNLFLLLFSSFFQLGLFGQVNPNSTYVNGYYKQNGTYVNGYNRTTPNSTINDNYSTSPNINPYTGTQGTIKPETNYYEAPKNNYYEAPKTNYYTAPKTNYYTAPKTNTKPTYYWNGGL